MISEKMSAPASFVPVELLDDTSDLHFVPAPCQVACPIGTDAPSYIGYIWEENFVGALEAISATNPFSSICGRVCDAPCEPACRRADSDGPIAIRNLKRFVMDKLGPDFHLAPVKVTRDKTVAIVGGGPAGLTAAQDIAEAGYEVHIYEMSDRLGGMMVWGIPAFRLPPRIIDEDINRILNHCPGIVVHFNHALGKNISLEGLKSKHDAVLLAIGAWWGKKMGIPGEYGPRVVDGVSFLRRINSGERPRMPETVVVVGGGDVAMDACRAALRLPGCRHVKVLYRRSPMEIPARRDELEGAIKEKVEFIYNTQPVGIPERDAPPAIRCLKTVMGDPEADGRRKPLMVEGSEHDIECGLVIAAVGQKAENEELEEMGFMADERIRADHETTATEDRMVFATGDGAFGPSTIVNAMYLGHRAAYYIKAFLEGRSDPMPYSTPYRTRRVPVAQDPEWEIFNRVDQPFHGLGKNPLSFPEIETTYTLPQAKEEAARCLRCDAENGTHEYSVNTREDIFIMARTRPEQVHKHVPMLNKRLANRQNPFPGDRGARLDDIHLLPANLSRLVIDPYREACKMLTRIGPSFELESPFLITGFDRAPEEIKLGLSEAIKKSGCAYFGARQLCPETPWMQLIPPSGGDPSADAAGHVYNLEKTVPRVDLVRRREDQLLGVSASSATISDAVPWAIDQGCDIIVLDGSGRLEEPWPELVSGFDLTVLRDAIAILRTSKMEEQINVVYFGGIRSGTDAAKAIALGCQSVIMSVSIALAMGGKIDDRNNMHFSADYTIEEYLESALNFLTASSGEASMMARGVGKTNIHSLEPEDLRSITLATSQATGIPLIGAH